MKYSINVNLIQLIDSTIQLNYSLTKFLIVIYLSIADRGVY